MAQRPNQLTPEASPVHRFGADLRALREDRGFSLADLAARVYRDRSSIAKIERGERTPRLEFAQLCDDALSADGALVRRFHVLFPAPWGPRMEPDLASTTRPLAVHTAGSAHWSQAVPGAVSPPQSTLDEEDGTMAVTRRGFIRSVGVGAVGAGALAGLPAAASAATQTDQAAHFQTALANLVDSDNLFGAHQVTAIAHEQVKLMERIRLGGNAAPELLAVQSEAAEFVGWLHQDLQDWTAAQFWTDRALQWAHMTGDTNLTALALARKAHVASDMGSGAEAIALGTAAERAASPGSRLAAVAATHRAHGHALLGDFRASEYAYDHARELLVDVDTSLPWAAWIDEAYVEVHRARSLASAAKFTDAAAVFDRAVHGIRVGYARDKGVYLVRAALAYAGAGQLEHAAGIGAQAVPLAVSTGSARMTAELRSLSRTLEPAARQPAIRQFREAMLAA